MRARSATRNVRRKRASADAPGCICEYAEIATKIGTLRIFERAGKVLCVELFPTPLETKRAELERKLKTRVELVAKKGLASAREIAEYFRGRRRKFDVPVDLSLSSGFQHNVLAALQSVPYGELVSYGELARRAKSPRAFRAVGGAMRQNPIPIIVPCHRVTASDGTLGGFSGGLETKRQLLELEGVAPLGGGWKAAKGVART